MTMSRSNLVLWLQTFGLLFGATLIGALPVCVQAQTMTAFTYQGYLEEGGIPVAGAYDLRFALYDSPSGGAQVGSTVTRENVGVTGGVFAVELDFGTVFDSGALRYLEVAVRESSTSGSFTTLSPREALRPAPSAITAYSLPNVTVDGEGKVGIGTETPASPLTVNGVIESTTGGIKFPDGTTQTTASSGTGSGSAWQLGGNSGLNPETDYLGTADETPLELRVNGERIMRLEPATDGNGSLNPNVIGGYPGNGVSADIYGATISGGGGTRNGIEVSSFVSGNYGTIGGGRGNVAAADATVGGGVYNRATELQSTVAGGGGNEATGVNSTVAGGKFNHALASYAVIGGGGGLEPEVGNVAHDEHGTIGGGKNNQTGSNDGDPTSAPYAFIGGGSSNVSSGRFSTVSGGDSNNASGASSSVIGGFGNRASGLWSAVGGGRDNVASGSSAAVGGGSDNDAAAEEATVGGGSNNTASGSSATVGGGSSNDARADYSTVGGGFSNDALGEAATVGGGNSNAASSPGAAVGGGLLNEASGSSATVGGGSYNDARGDYATVPGGRNNDARGDYSFAAGYRARVTAAHEGSFVWADASTSNAGNNTGDSLVTTGANQFLIRAVGGVGIGTDDPRSQLHVESTISGSALARNHVAIIENNATSGGDVLALKTSASTPGVGENFITFKSVGSDVGAIEGNGSGGVVYKTSGADFAEMMPRVAASEPIAPGAIVGVVGGRITKVTDGADRLMVVTDRAAVLGNATEGDNAASSPVAFIGQVPVRVEGSVHVGDWIVASSRGDGIGRAVAPDQWDFERDGPIVGQAWDDQSGGTGRVNTAVGLDTTRPLIDRITRQQRVLDQQQAQIDALQEQVRALRDLIRATRGVE